MSADVGTAFLNAKTSEKVYAIAGKEFGEDEGKTVIIVRALYRLKSSGAAWRSHFANSLRDFGFQSCLADPDVWYKPATKSDGTEYYEYVLVYVDDLLHISHEPKKLIQGLQEDL
jgi:Reverse transcriptase (RNA-dependent DNA polymerase)